MERNIKSLIDYAMGATDGEIGNVEEFYFDDETWTIRYMIVKTGGWLFGRKVLISPEALQKPNWEKKEFPVNLTQEQIKNSPDIDTDMPVSRRMEIELYEHYPWQGYWGSAFYAGSTWGVISPAPVLSVTKEIISTERNSEDDEHLRSTQQVANYQVHATDGDIGHVYDFIIDDTTWQLKYLVIDTHNYFGGKKVLVDVKNIKEVSWGQSKIILAISKAVVNECALFDELKYNHPESDKSNFDNG